MNGILRYLLGTVTAELVSADPGRALSFYAGANITFTDPAVVAPLTLRVQLPAHQWRRFSALAEKRGDTCKVIARQGLHQTIREKRKRLPFLAVLCAMLLFALYAPTRLWFFRVEGNETIPSGEIVAVAQECGLTFWTRVKDVSSEEFKNQILNRIPELQWAGVNFTGGVATISVQQRLEGEAIRDTEQIANVVASRDGIILSMSVLGGQALCQPGQAVTAGEVLVTGCIEHEYQTQYTCADAEVYALTQRDLVAVYPRNTLAKRYTGQEDRCVKLILGRNKIKISGNSGISGTTCDKMTEEKVLTLPGGYMLPVALVTETYRFYETEPVDTAMVAEDILMKELCQYVQADMIAGEILSCTSSMVDDGGVYRLNAIYSCREMIARQWKVTLFEGENTNDGTDRERRAG